MKAVGGYAQLLLLSLGFILNEKVKELSVLRVNALAIFGYVTAEHFPITNRNLFHRVLLSETFPWQGLVSSKGAFLLHSRRRPGRVSL